MAGPGWVAASQAVRIASQLIGVLVVARIIGPTEYGIMAMAGVVTNFAMIFRDLGTSSALIQRDELDRETKTAVFWFNLAVGVSIAMVVLAFAPFIAVAFEAPKLVAVLAMLALAFPISSAGAAHQALLERDQRFRPVASGEIAGALLGALVCIAMALAGAGVFSLVAQALIAALVPLIAVWRALKWRPSAFRRYHIHSLRKVMGFSSHLVGFNLISYASRNADSVVAGRMFGAAPLGAYSLAYRVMLFPLQSLTFVATRVLYPRLSRLKGDYRAVSEIHLGTVRAIAALVAPLMAGICVLREEFIQVIAGPGWVLAANILIWLAPTGFLQSISSTTSVVFMSMGKTKELLAIASFSSLLQIIAVVVGAFYGIEQMAAAYFVANIVVLVVNACSCRIMLGVGILEPFGALVPPVLSAAMMALLIFAVKERVADYFGGSISISLVVSVTIGSAMYLLLLWLISPSFFRALLVLFRNNSESREKND